MKEENVGRQSLERRPEECPTSTDQGHDLTGTENGVKTQWVPGETLPPVGDWVYLTLEEENVEVVAHGVGQKFCGRDQEGYIGIFDASTCEPIQSHRDKCIELAMSAYEEYGYNAKKLADPEIIAEALYDAGLLRLPNDKEGE